MKQVFEGIRIVDATQGMAGALATMIFADFGADVIRVEPLDGDPCWSHPAYLLWNRGKRSIELDTRTPRGRQAAEQLITTADVLIESYHPGAADALGVGYDTAARLNPALVYLSVSAFGPGPYRDLPAYDGIVNAKSGRMREQVGHHANRPVFRAVNDTSYHTAMFSVQSVIAALRVAWATGQGQRLDTSLLHGVTAPNNPWRRFEGQELPPDVYPGHAGGADVLRGELVPDRRETDPYHAIPSQLCTQCKDGRWIMHSHAQFGLFRSWIKTIGFEWIWDDPRFRGAPSSFASDEHRVVLNLAILARMKEKTAAEWIELYVQNPDCCGEIMETTQEALRHPQFVHNGHLIEIDDPRVGRMKQVGPFARMSETPAVISTPAPFPGQHTAEVLGSLPARKEPSPAPRTEMMSPSDLLRGPLDGIVVLELASWLAAPFSGTLLADLGARVIKIEPLTGDPFRAMITNENGIRATQGKESLAVDLKTPEGRQVLHKLVARADVLMHNFRPGVPERLGMDYQTLRSVKPDLVYLYAASYGSTGPHSQRAAFNPTMGALSGNSVFQSGEGNVPIGDQSPDPIAGSGVATGMMLGLAARLRTGRGQYLETTMMNSIVYCNSDDAFDYDGKPPRRNPDQAQLGLEATYRLYETREGWVFLAAHSDAEFTRFAVATGRAQLAADPRWSSIRGRYENRAELATELEGIFRQDSAANWEARLTDAGVGCVQADGAGHRRFLHTDPHLRAMRFMVPTAHPMFASQAPGGRYWRHRPVVQFSRTPCEEGKPYVALGEHTRQILAEFGYSETEIAGLSADDIVGWPAENEEAIRT
jgi:crotonobetainyl-CoA:carnitine CoA-transferase CaiB-like acyl-CoA transferase